MAEILIRLLEDSRTSGVCRGCHAPLDWYETLQGRKMPMNHGAVPRKSEKDPDTWRVIAYFSADDSHFTTCPDSASFSHKARR